MYLVAELGLLHSSCLLPVLVPQEDLACRNCICSTRSTVLLHRTVRPVSSCPISLPKSGKVIFGRGRMSSRDLSFMLEAKTVPKSSSCIPIFILGLTLRCYFPWSRTNCSFVCKLQETVCCCTISAPCSTAAGLTNARGCKQKNRV